MFLIWSKSNKKKLIGKLDYFININGIKYDGRTNTEKRYKIHRFNK